MDSGKKLKHIVEEQKLLHIVGAKRGLEANYGESEVAANSTFFVSVEELPLEISEEDLISLDIMGANQGLEATAGGG